MWRRLSRTGKSLGKWEARFDIINLFDEVYQIRNGTGVGVGASANSPRRGFFGGLRKSSRNPAHAIGRPPRTTSPRSAFAGGRRGRSG